MTARAADEPGGGITADDTTAGLAIAAGSLLSMLLMAHHPTAGGGDPGEVIARIGRMAALNGFVHGGLIFLMGVVLFGFVGLSGRLGWRSARVRAGMVAYAMGAALLTGAALVNGFILPSLAQRYTDVSQAEMEGFRHLSRFCWAANQALADAGVVGTSVAVILWSLVMARLAGSARFIGWAGVVVGALPILGLISGGLRLHLAGMTAVIAGQTLWNLCVAGWLLRGWLARGT